MLFSPAGMPFAHSQIKRSAPPDDPLELPPPPSRNCCKYRSLPHFPRKRRLTGFHCFIVREIFPGKGDRSASIVVSGTEMCVEWKDFYFADFEIHLNTRFEFPTY
ncbi:hypothetical protein CEXT_813881 [Caerostris extrusa]|uniref:Uncharacterized protein n=1 Tax=Caerostris extrusa TaxID=172846 RepID=A0AAV4S2Y4_CAEEX|nr:hypothetical protein CEXT_813881 [Caerostris extrusa]